MRAFTCRFQLFNVLIYSGDIQAQSIEGGSVRSLCTDAMQTMPHNHVVNGRLRGPLLK